MQLASRGSEAKSQASFTEQANIQKDCPHLASSMYSDGDERRGDIVVFEVQIYDPKSETRVLDMAKRIESFGRP